LVGIPSLVIYPHFEFDQLDLTLLAKKLVDEGAVNEFYHPIAFMAELPLNHE
jgi:hypothetical protein